MAAITVYTAQPVDEFISGTPAGTITAAGTHIDDSQLPALQAAAAQSHVTIGVGTPPTPAHSGIGAFHSPDGSITITADQTGIAFSVTAGAGAAGTTVAKVTGEYLGSAATFATLPTVDKAGNPAVNGDWAALTADVVGTGTAQAPQYPRGIYVTTGAAFSLVLSISADGALLAANNLTDLPNPAQALAVLGGAPLAAVVPATKSPSPVLETVPMMVYGASYDACEGTPYALSRWFDRVTTRTRSQRATNNAVSGWQAQDGCLFAFGSFAAARATPGTGASNSAGTFPTAPFVGGVVFIDFGRNNVGHDQDASKGDTQAIHRAAFANGLHSLIRLARAGSRIEDNAAAFVYTGTWGNGGNDSHFSGGSYHGSNTPGDYVTITTPVGTDFDLVLIGTAPQNGVQGGPFTVTLDGQPWNAPYGPMTGLNQWDSTNALGIGFGQLCLPFHGLSNQAHTIKVTNTGTASQNLFVDSLLVQSPTPPTVMLMKVAQVGAVGYAAYPTVASYAVDQAYNAIIDQVAANIGVTDQSIVVWDPNANGWDWPSMVSGVDPQHLHPNDKGTNCYADGTMTALNTLPARLGLVVV